MITTDGDRSKKRLWFAKKQLAVISDLDLPAKTVSWDGFTFKVWQDGDLSGGRITAPMGAVVLCSSGSGIKVSVADYWLGAFVTYGDLHVIYKDSPGNNLSLLSYNLLNEEQMVDDGVEIVKFRPELTASPFGLVDGTEVGEDTVYVQDYSPLPGIMPFHTAEGFWLSSTAKFYIDFNNNGMQDFPKWIADSTLTFYNSDGSNLSGRRTATAQVGGRFEMAGASQPQRIYQQLDKDLQVMHQAAVYERTGGKIVRGWNILFPNFTPFLMESCLAASSMPDELEEIFLADSEWNNMYPIGSYSSLHNGVQVFLQASDATNTIKWDGNTPAYEWFELNPSQEHWKLFLTLTVGELSYVVSSSQFIGLLDSLASVTIIGSSTNWQNALRMMYQLFPHPNNNFNVPYDSVMFHAHDGDIYTWTRSYGAVKFTSTGIHSASVSVPAEVSGESGVRPDISYAGTFDDAPLYLCVCNKVKEEVKAIYYGSPFGSWEQLPGPAEGQTLVHARPVSVSPGNIVLIGVVKETAEEVPFYSFALLNWTGGEDTWKKLGRLPFAVTDFDAFQVGLFGENKLVNDLAGYLSPPPILPQMPVGPYSKYTIGMP